MNEAESYLSAMGLLSKPHDELFDIAVDLNKRMDNEYAFLLLEYIIDQGCEEVVVFNRFGLVSIQLQKHDIARKSFERSYALDPNNNHTHIMLANVYSRSRDYDRAIHFLSRGIEGIEKNDRLMAYCFAVRAYMHKAKGDTERYKSDMSRAVEYSPDIEEGDFKCKLCVNIEKE